MRVGDDVYNAADVVLATGSDAVIPPVPGLRELDGVWTNREATGLTELPRRLLVLGGGPVGLELGQALARMGSSVAIVEGMSICSPASPSRSATRSPRRSPPTASSCYLGRQAASARRDGADYVLELSDGTTLRGDRLLVATGRRARVDGPRARVRGHRAEPPRRRGRRAHARGRWHLGDRRRHRHLAADLRRQVPGPRRRRQHPRPAARGRLLGRAARGLHRSAGRRRRRHRRAADRHRLAGRRCRAPRRTRARTTPGRAS